MKCYLALGMWYDGFHEIIYTDKSNWRGNDYYREFGTCIQDYTDFTHSVFVF